MSGIRHAVLAYVALLQHSPPIYEIEWPESQHGLLLYCYSGGIDVPQAAQRPERTTGKRFSL
jgi:hypothetical protein